MMKLDYQEKIRIMEMACGVTERAAGFVGEYNKDMIEEVFDMMVRKIEGGEG